ncbi:MAG: carbamoyltransferase HypF [Anaerolineales bacterium]
MAKHISVKGVVQGAGFRPFVVGLATRLDLHGWVCNTSAGVEIIVDGQNSSVEKFIQTLTLEKPPLAHIDSIQVEEAPPDSSVNFEIRESQAVPEEDPPISADIAICPDCERELFNPKDKRYLYPFINCAHCGPRFTILKDIPYDRLNTTMAHFSMCDHCREEYTNPLNRRFHAQPIACPDCGPFVELRETHSQFPTSDPRVSSIEIRTSAILKARRLLREGYIVAIKGLEGFHLACDASNPYTLAELRDRKGRVDKPFAVMAATMSAIASVCNVQREEHLLLAGPEKPIVLLARTKQTGPLTYKVSELVAPNLDTLGVMLPYTPLQHLLLNQTDPVLAREPVPPILVMTSGNFSEEPIAVDNEDALERLSPLADAFLLHNRNIHTRAEDSVARVDHGNIVYLRRSRGYVPGPVRLPFELKATLAVGGERKNTFCLARGHDAFLSQHIGDMGNPATHEPFRQGVEHLSHILRIVPEIIAHDLHPDYFTTQYAHRSTMDVQHIGVQHHHAHIASCMADNGLDERQLIGLSFDGTGYGTDGAVWGGEVLLASYADFGRFAHLEYLPLPSGDSAIRSPWRIAVGYAHALGIDIDHLPFLQNMDEQLLRMVRQEINQPMNSTLNSSMGCLFDAIASLIGIHNDIAYAAQAAIEMEVLAKPLVLAAKPYPYVIEESPGGILIRLRELLCSIVEDVQANSSIGMIGARFHKTGAKIAVDICKRARAKTDLNEVALSGGVWQNQILLDLVRDGLRREGFIVYFHKQIPTNDGGLALGQAMIANFQASNREEHGAREENLFRP